MSIVIICKGNIFVTLLFFEMESLFKEGQTVRIAPRRFDSSDYRFGYVPAMGDYAGRVATIVSVDFATIHPRRVPDDGYKYIIDIDEGRYTWASSMFTSMEEPPSKVTPTSSDEPISTEICIHIKRDTKIKFNFKN